MKYRNFLTLLGASALAFPVFAQSAQWPMPPQVEAELAARSYDSVEVSLGKPLLHMAAEATKGVVKADKGESPDLGPGHVLNGLDGVYFRDYKFKDEKAITKEDVQKIRQIFETSEWTPTTRMHKEREAIDLDDIDSKSKRDPEHEYVDVMTKQVNGEVHGLFVLTAKPRELVIALILGPIRIEDLGDLNNLKHFDAKGMLGVISGATHRHHDSDEEPVEVMPEATPDTTDAPTDVTRPVAAPQGDSGISAPVEDAPSAVVPVPDCGDCSITPAISVKKKGK